MQITLLCIYYAVMCYYDKYNFIYIIYMINTLPNLRNWWLGEFRDNI